MIEFYVVSHNVSPFEDLSQIQVQSQIGYNGPVGPKGEKYISSRMAHRIEVEETFERIRQNLDLAEQRALALLRENSG